MLTVEERPLIKMYKKSECCRNEWLLWHEFRYIKDKYIPVRYETPGNSKYSKAWYGIRYIKKDDILNY